MTRRMAREGELLAALGHPRFPQHYEAGLIPEDWPWPAIEPLGGLPPDVFYKRRGLSMHSRGSLFLQIAEAASAGQGCYESGLLFDPCLLAQPPTLRKQTWFCCSTSICPLEPLHCVEHSEANNERNTL
jgi:hypothetical protein